MSVPIVYAKLSCVTVNPSFSRYDAMNKETMIVCDGIVASVKRTAMPSITHP